MRPAFLLIALTLSAHFSGMGGEEAPWVPVTVCTRDGSRLTGLLKAAPPSLALRKGTGADESTPWSEVKRVELCERFDPDQENQARLAIGELQSDQYEMRKRALERIRAIGRPALASLREALRSPDPEVAARSKELLVELGAEGAGEGGDSLVLTDERKLQGEMKTSAVEVRTLWGFLKFSLPSLARIEILPAEQRAEIEKELSQAAIDSAKPLNARPPPSEPVTALARQLLLEDLESLGLGGPQARLGDNPFLEGLRLATFNTGPDGKVKLEAGALVEDTYAPWGVLLRAGESTQQITADNTEELLGLSHGLAASVKEPRGQGAIELRFILPSSFDPKSRQGRMAGVRRFGCIIGKASEGQIGMEAFDRSGRLLLRIFNNQEGKVAAGGAMAGEFMGVSAQVPIARVRLFRVPGHPESTLRIDDLTFDRPVSVDRDERFAAVELRSGERLVGELALSEKSPPESLAIRPLFLPADAAPVMLKLDTLKRFDPPLRFTTAAANPLAGPDPNRTRPVRAAHGVLMQNGEIFRAQLSSLDQEFAMFGLSGGVELKLPRAALRKVDLRPEPAAPGDAVLSVGADEKPGVEFRKKSAGNPAAPQPEPAPDDPAKKLDPVKNPAQGLPRMDNAEILSVNLENNELVVDPKDGGGAWPIDLATVRFLVFPELKQAAGAEKKPPAWTLLLRQGSRFEAHWKGVNQKGIQAEIAGGTVELPFAVVESMERK